MRSRLCSSAEGSNPLKTKPITSIEDSNRNTNINDKNKHYNDNIYKTKNSKKKKFIKSHSLHPSQEPISCLDTDPSLDIALRGLDLSLLLTHITPGFQPSPPLMSRQQMIMARRLPIFNFPSTLYQPAPVLQPRRLPPPLDRSHDTDLPSYDPPDDTPVATSTTIDSLDTTLVNPLFLSVPTHPEQPPPDSTWPSDLPSYVPPSDRSPPQPPFPRHDTVMPSDNPLDDTLVASCTTEASHEAVLLGPTVPLALMQPHISHVLNPPMEDLDSLSVSCSAICHLGDCLTVPFALLAITHCLQLNTSSPLDPTPLDHPLQPDSTSNESTSDHPCSLETLDLSHADQVYRPLPFCDNPLSPSVDSVVDLTSSSDLTPPLHRRCLTDIPMRPPTTSPLASLPSWPPSPPPPLNQFRTPIKHRLSYAFTDPFPSSLRRGSPLPSLSPLNTRERPVRPPPYDPILNLSFHSGSPKPKLSPPDSTPDSLSYDTPHLKKRRDPLSPCSLNLTSDSSLARLLLKLSGSPLSSPTSRNPLVRSVNHPPSTPLWSARRRPPTLTATPSPDFSLSSNNRPGCKLSCKPKSRLFIISTVRSPTRLPKLRKPWAPKSAARRRLQRRRPTPSIDKSRFNDPSSILSTFLISHVFTHPPLHDSISLLLFPHDFSHAPQSNSVFYWEFKA
jgi:hypothetical protein